MAASINAFKFEDEQEYLNTLVNFVTATSFTSGTTKTSDDGFGDVRVGTIIIVTGSSASVHIVTAVDSSTKVITASCINNA